MDWLWQGFISQLIWELIGIAGMGLLLAFLKKKVPEHAPAIGYGLFGVTCAAILLFVFTGHALLTKSKPQITEDNVEKYVKEWSDTMGLGVTTVDEVPGFGNEKFIFAIKVSLKDGNQMYAFRANKNGGWLNLYIPIQMAQAHLAILNQLSKDEREVVNDEITAEMAKANVTFQQLAVTGGMGANGIPIVASELMGISKAMAVDEVTEGRFMDATNEVDRTIFLLKATTSLALSRYRQDKAHVKQQ